MTGLIKEEAEVLKKEVPSLNKLSEEYLFSLVCYKYFYKEGKLSYSDYINVFVDGKNDGGLDLVDVVEDGNGQFTLVLIQSKDIINLQNFNDVIDVFRKMHTTYTDFIEGRTSSYSTRLKQKFKDKLAEVEDQSPNINFIVFYNAEISTERINTINEKIENEIMFDPYEISIFDRKDIEEQIGSVKDPKKFVEQAKIKVAKEDKYIKYGENGLLVNIYASSIRDLFDRFKDKGLFEQNFRYFIKNKRIDDNIRDSLSKKRDKFWFLNNGIIIGCSDFTQDGDFVKLYNFSIINGCQTATLIGQYKGFNKNLDFVIPCKLVKPDETQKENFENFISEIAESSNSQKPISDRDLKSNKVEQRKLQADLKKSDPKIYLEIKRGVSKKRNLESWQNVLNDTYGQLILSFILQQPATARSGKKKIFADENVYNRIFKRNYDKETIIDILKLNSYYLEFIDKKDDFNDLTQENIATNGRLTTLAIIGFLLKIKRNLINLKYIGVSEVWEKEIQKDNLTGGLFSKNIDDKFDENLHSLFIVIIQELHDLFQKNEKLYKTVSNFFKLDGYYFEDITKHIKNRLVDIPAKKREIDGYMKIFH